MKLINFSNKTLLYFIICISILNFLSPLNLLSAILPDEIFAQEGTKTENEKQNTMGEFNTLEKKPEGTEFWLTFMLNNEEPEKPTESTKLHLELFFTGDKDAKVTIEIKSIGYKETIKINKGTVRSILINTLAQIRTSEVIEEKHALHITSDNPITVYGLTRRKQTTDSFMGLPTNVIGKNYRVICYNVAVKLSEFAIVATEDSTIVKITPSVETQMGRLPGETFEIKLNKGDVYQVIARDLQPAKKKNDLTGSQINANKKISVFSGHQCAYVPDKVFACNHLVEQVPPIVSWGKHFYIGMLKKRSKYTYRVLADKDSTKVFENGKLQKILMAGEHFEKQANDHIQLTSDKPVLVAQYSQGYKNGDKIGDPMMLLISPTQQFLKKYRFATPVNGTWEHFINVIVPSRATSSLVFNGKRLDSTKFKPLANSSYSVAQLNINFGTHELEGVVPFGMSSYGFGYANENYDAYGTIGGQSFIEYVPKEDEEPPYIETKDNKENITIIIRDDRKDDTGINLINVLNAEGLRLIVPKYDIGTPQTQIVIEKDNATLKNVGKMQLSIEDMYKNVNNITICYSYDPFYGSYRFSVSDGLDVNCFEDPGIFYGVNFKYLYNSFDLGNNTSRIGNVVSNGNFSDYTSSGGYASVYYVQRLSQKFYGKIKLSFDNLNGNLVSPDSLIARIFDPSTQTFENYQEQRNIKLSAINLNLNIGTEYYLSKFLYLQGGLLASFMTSSEIENYREILIPIDKAFDIDGNRIKAETPNEISTLNKFGFGLFGGVGIIFPLNSDILFNLETNYNFRLNSLVSDQDWYLRNIGLEVGLRFRL